MSAIDGLLRRVGLQRTDRHGGKPHGRRSYFRGALRNRFTLGIGEDSASADAELWTDFRQLKNRSRAAVRDNPHAAALRRVWVTGTVGPIGLQHYPMVENREGQLNLRVNDQLSDWWRDWCAPGNCTVDRRHSGLSLQTLIGMTEFTDGEFLALEIEDPSVNATGYALQLLDTDQLDENYTARATDDHGEIRMGVEVDQWGAPAFYHIWDRNPHDLIGGRPIRQRVPASEVIHYYEPQRPGQTRGIPRMSAALYMMHMQRKLDEAELVASIIAANTSFVYEQDPNAPVENDDGDPEGIIPEDQEPGERTLLPKGVRAVMLQPTHPNSTYPAASKKWLRDMGAATGMAYHAFTGDLTDVNFSSLRAGENGQRDVFKGQHPRLAALLTRMYRRALKNAVLRGQLHFQKDDWREYAAVRFDGRGFDQVDPLKEMTANSMALALRLDSRSRLASESGQRIEDILRDNQRDQLLAAAFGVTMPDPLPTGVQQALPDTPDDPADEGNDDASGNDAAD